ncbi:MAG: SpoIIE family protein phosphatase [Betaproteobacteria bacterium]|nr:SpoIIE family protein phosphatase [Betaproteobacteria bacterium]
MSQATAEELKQFSVLYAEDEEDIRKEVGHFLERHVGKLIVAANGEEALAAFAVHKPDIVISDIMMPAMDGLRLAEAIKERSRTTPVIFTTAFNDVKYLHRAIDLGVDGYVLKPIDLKQLLAVFSKTAALLLKNRELVTSRAQLEAYHQAAEDERRLVAELMERMMRPENLRDPQVRYWLKPTDVVSGDLIALSRSRNRKLYFMLADSTGHGLPAALNLLPVNHIFYSMVSKNLPLTMMVEEMNWAVKEQSPTGRYVAALVACIDLHNRLVEIWNGGIPSAFFIGEDGRGMHTFDSVNLPLGILDRTFTAQTEVFQWSEPGQLVVYSDGLSEAENEAGEPFGLSRIEQVLRQAAPAERFSGLTEALNAHLGGRRAFDDMTLMLVECVPA